MKHRTLHFLAFSAIFGLCVPLGAAADVTHEQFTSPLAGSAFVLCAGEIISYQGQFFAQEIAVTTPLGDLHRITTSVFQHVTGEGGTTGTIYHHVSSGGAVQHSFDGEPRILVARNRTAFIAPGSGNDQFRQGRTMVITNGQGEPVVEKHENELICR